MRRGRLSPVLIAGLLALLSALGLIALVSSSDGALRLPNATEQQETVNAIVRTRLTQTAERLQLTPEVTATVSP